MTKIKNDKFRTSDPNTFYLDNYGYNVTRNNMLESSEQLLFDTTAFDMETEINGTESVNRLINYWHLVATTSTNYRNFYVNDVDSMLGRTQNSIITTNANAANALKVSTHGVPYPLSSPGNIPSDPNMNIAVELDAAMKMLCDDNDSNDKEAIKTINNLLRGFITVKTIDGKQYIAYDQNAINNVVPYLEKDGLAYQLLNSLNEQIESKKEIGDPYAATIIEFGYGAKLYNTKLEVVKDNAGARLEITSNNDLFPLNEIDHQFVAYAATEESAENFFKNGDEYDWDALEKWYKSENLYETSVEYDYLAYEMSNMSDEDIEKLINSAEYKADILGYGYNISKKLELLTDIHVVQLEAISKLSDSNSEFDDKYTRAVMINGIVTCMTHSGAGKNHIVEISYSTDEVGRRIYTGEVTCANVATSGINPWSALADSMASRKVVVYPSGDALDIDTNLHGEVNTTAQGMATGFGQETSKFIIEQGISYAADKLGMGLPATFGQEINNMIAAYESCVDAQGIQQCLETGTAAQCMKISGVTVHISGSSADYAYVYMPEYDDNSLFFSVSAYNQANGTDYTVEEMKNEYLNMGDAYHDYEVWYTNGGDKEGPKLRDSIIEEYGYKPSELDSMSVEELEQILETAE